jgi:hypothetical protein
MKRFVYLSFFAALVLSSCVSIRVASDFDKEIDFSNYTTYAFYKKGVDQVEINDLDKKRILRSIANAMESKGFSASENPDLLINFKTTSEENVAVNQDPYGYFGFGWGPYWSPFYGGFYTHTFHSSVEGILYIDLIDATTKSLVWQGKGVGNITVSSKDRDARVDEFVTKIMENYPPQQVKKN